jgi:hypothetical protein
MDDNQDNHTIHLKLRSAASPVHSDTSSKDSIVPLIAHARYMYQATSPLATSPIEVATNVANCSSIVTFEAISRDHLPIGAPNIEISQFLHLLQ